jgi:circadian clock protein KaiB
LEWSSFRSPEMVQRKKRSTGRLQSADARRPMEHYVLKLYVSGATVRSLRAIANLKAICEQYLKGRYDLEVVDIYRQPAVLSGDQVVAVPTLIRKLPAPVRLLVGDLSRTEQVLQGLDLAAHAP